MYRFVEHGGVRQPMTEPDAWKGNYTDEFIQRKEYDVSVNNDFLENAEPLFSASTIEEKINQFIEEKQEKKDEVGGSLPRSVALRQLKELREKLLEEFEQGSDPE